MITRVKKTKCIITRMKRCMMDTLISLKDYLMKEMSKANRPRVDS